MAARSNVNDGGSEQEGAGITEITVAGFKCIRNKGSIDVRPLTVLAGANSSGKSSIVQPLLLLKQTLEATYDPGPLLLNGPNVRFTDAEQLFSRTDKGQTVKQFYVDIKFGPTLGIGTHFSKDPKTGLQIAEASFLIGDKTSTLKRNMPDGDIRRVLPQFARRWDTLLGTREDSVLWEAGTVRCFLRPVATIQRPQGGQTPGVVPSGPLPVFLAEQCIPTLIHLPGLRGNPERNYPMTGVRGTFPGLFQDYVASIIARWHADKNEALLKALCDDLKLLGLTWKVAARRVSDAEVELQVGRLPRAVRGAARDLVNIADVGFGVSQALPVVVALHVATPKHLVYLEQPEIHLHPRAQVAMAQVLARAVKRGVRIVAETHSPLLLLAIQTLVAQGDLSPDLVRLHWFTRSETTGVTEICSADLDDAGAFGDWPEDFGSVEAQIENRYLSAAEAKLLKK